MREVPKDIATANRMLADALAGLYVAFAPYHMPRKLHGSPLRDPAKIYEDLKSAALKELPAVAIGPFAHYAMTTVGDVRDYKHFLPRIIHLGIVGGDGEPGLDAQLIASKLAYANWAKWPELERAAVFSAFEAAWARVRFFHPDDRDAEEWLTGCAMLGVSIVPHISVWIADTDTKALTQFAQFVVRMTSIRDTEGYWSDVPHPIRSEIQDYLCGQEISDTLNGALDRVERKDLWMFNEAQKTLEQLRGG